MRSFVTSSPAKNGIPETALDYFGARYYSSTLARFMTPDWAATPIPVPYAKTGLPQTLNLYSYVDNNPITGIDPDGHDKDDGFSAPPENQAPEVKKVAAEQTAQDKKTVTVTVQKVKAYTRAGHAVIQVGNGKKVGLVPDSHKAAVAAGAAEVGSAAAGHPQAFPVAGHVEELDPKTHVEETATLQVTPDQANHMQEQIDSDAKNLHTWDPGYLNCAEWVGSVLSAGGVKTPYDITPGGLVEDLNKQNQH